MAIGIHWIMESYKTNEEIKKSLINIRHYCLTQSIFKEVNKIKYYPNCNAEDYNNEDAVIILTMAEKPKFSEEGTVLKYIKPIELYNLNCKLNDNCKQLVISFGRYPDEPDIWISVGQIITQYCYDITGTHIGLINLFDEFKKENFILDIEDDGKYWETRDINILANNINKTTKFLKESAEKVREYFKIPNHKFPIDEHLNFVEIK